MENITDTRVIIFSLILGTIPALIWLWFWHKEDKACPEPKGLILISFILGMASTILVIPIEKLIKSGISDHNTMIILIALAEESLKLMAVAILAFKSKYLDEPIDYAIYIMTAAMGFAALENALFLIEPIGLTGSTTAGLLTGSLRFLGATLLHGVASGLVGIMLGFAFYKSAWVKKIALLFGLVVATSVHAIFNFFIINNQPDMWKIFGSLWILAVFCMFLFERLEKMKKENFVCIS